MQEYFTILKKNILFSDLTEDNLCTFLKYVKAYVKNYKTSETIREYDTGVTEIGIVVRGNCHAIRIDINGNRHILRDIGIGTIFGDTLAFSGFNKSPLLIIATAECTVMFIPVKKIFTDLTNGLNKKIIDNLIKLLAVKGVLLQIKNDILSRPSIREKLLTYFEYKSDEAGSNAFIIPFSRTALADYLGVNRSALVRELGKMQQEGILSYNKKAFVLKLKSLENRYN